MYSFFGTIAILSLLLLTFNVHASAASPENVQYQALMTRYFLRTHRAIPIFSNGSVKSADIIRLPDALTFRRGPKCFSNVIFDPLNLDAQTIASDLGLSLALGGSIPVEEIFEIESAVGGVFKDDFHIVLDPFAQDEQGDLTKFLKIQEPCKTALKDRINKTKETFIIAGRVFRAKIRGEVNFEISGELDANGEIRIADRMKDIIGGDIKLTVTGVGHLATIHSVRSPDVQSVAVVSATLDTETLARIYLKLRDNVQGRELENLVEQYVHERDPGVLLQTSARIENLLREAQLFYSDMLELYKSVFGGDGAQPVDLRELGPDEEWEAFGLVASANLIAQANR